MDIERIRNVIAEMKLGEKLDWSSGTFAAAIERLKIPELNLSLDLFCSDEPSTLALGCTFSREICKAASLARVENAARNGRSVAGNIACGVMTDPMREDAVDFFSDDPYLSGELLSAYADVGLGYVFTDALGQGRFENRTIDSRALYEVYLRPLEHAGKFAAGLVLDGGYLNEKEIYSTRTIYDMYAKLVPRDAVIFSLEFGDDERSAGVFRLGATAAENKAIARAVTDGVISEKKIDFCVERSIAAAANAHEYYKNKEPAEAVMPDLFFDSAVLLKNEILPTDSDPVIFGDRSYFDDGKNYSVHDVSDGVKRCGALNLFFVTDELTAAQKLAVENVASMHDAIVAVCGHARELDFAKDAKAVLFLPYAPRISDVIELINDKEPRGRLPFAWGVRRDDYPRNNKRFAPRGDFRFASVYGGHAYFDAFTAPLYPFGHGLSFARFDIKKLSVKNSDAPVAQVTVANSGERSGSALVEVYATYRGSGAYGIVKRLIGFERAELNAGEEKKIDIALDMRSVRVYDACNQRFVTVGGKYGIEVGFSSLDIRARSEIKLDGESKVGFTRKDLPNYYGGENLEPTAPEIEKLFGISFIKKSVIEISLPDGKHVKKCLAKIKKSACKRMYASAAYKAAHTPADITERSI